MAVKILRYSVNSGPLNSATPLQKKWATGGSLPRENKRNCSVRDGLVLWERKRVFGEEMLIRNEIE
jgi:hypothetical protein